MIEAELLTHLHDHWLIVTPNNRLSQQLLQDYYQHQKTAVLDKPLCLPYQTWLSWLWQQLRYDQPYQSYPVVLTALQQHYAWQQILPDHASLLQSVQQAWSHCQQWQIDMQHAAFQLTPQTRQFQTWHQQFLQYLNDKQAITAEQIIPILLKTSIKLPLAGIIWYCFDDYTPQQQALQQWLTQLDCPQIHYDLPQNNPEQSEPPYCFTAADKQDEQQQFIMWLKARLAYNEQHIAVVVADLAEQAPHLQRLLQRHFDSRLFNLSMGRALLDYPLVAHALQWLQFDKQRLAHTDMRLLLHSPFIAGANREFIRRAQHLQLSRALQEPETTWSFFINECQQYTPILAQILTDITPYPAQATPTEWIGLFTTRLNQIGFPGDTVLNSEAYQCWQRFITLLEELQPLHLLTEQLTATEALQALLTAAQMTVFQAQKAVTPIQILGLLEASGGHFDSVWVCGLTDQCLPQKPHLSAFIPLSIQRQYQMPHAVAAKELLLAQQFIARLCAGSQHQVFSYPRLNGDMPHLPSPLIKHFQPWNRLAITTTVTPSLLQPYTEHYQLPVNAEEQISGGTAILANQAKCPFRAFAAHRLHATAPLPLSYGLDASERGQVIHRILEQLWRKLDSQQALLQYNEQQLQDELLQIIREVVAPYRLSRAFSFGPLIQDVEITRLQQLVNAHLSWEKQRPPFVIEALEQVFTVKLADLAFRVRIDRLDRLIAETPTKWVIDYKTTLPSTKPWHEERPEAPQLLLYALLDDSINALLFVQLKAGKITCSGLSEEPFAITGISSLKKNEHWQDYQQQWQQQLTSLAAEFKAGHCPPQPHKASTCQQCEFQSLCRKT